MIHCPVVEHEAPTFVKMFWYYMECLLSSHRIPIIFHFSAAYVFFSLASRYPHILGESLIMSSLGGGSVHLSIWKCKGLGPLFLDPDNSAWAWPTLSWSNASAKDFKFWISEKKTAGVASQKWQWQRVLWWWYPGWLFLLKMTCAFSFLVWMQQKLGWEEEKSYPSWGCRHLAACVKWYVRWGGQVESSPHLPSVTASFALSGSLANDRRHTFIADPFRSVHI